MFSLPKLLLLVAIIALVLLGFRLLGRVDRLRQANERQNRAKPAPRLEAEDLIKCARCGVYVSPAGGVDCDRADCPHQ